MQPLLALKKTFSEDFELEAAGKSLRVQTVRPR
jgi:hypothetical protein